MRRAVFFLTVLITVFFGLIFGVRAKDYIEIWPEGWSEVRPLFATSIFADRFSVEHDAWGTSTLSVDGLYFRELNLTYRLIQDAAVQEELVLVQGKELDNPLLGLDALGNRHLLWLERSWEGNSLNYTRFSVPYQGHEKSVFWETSHTIQDLSAVQVGGTTHLVWSERDPYYQIMYGRLEQGQLVEAEAVTESIDLSVRPSIIVDEGGTLHLAWYETTPLGVNVFYSKKEAQGWTPPVKIGEGSVLDIQEGGTIALTARDGRVYLAWATIPRNANRLFVHLAEVDEQQVGSPRPLAVGSRPRFVQDEASALQLVWQGVGQIGAQIHHGIYQEGQLTEKTNLTVGRRMAFRPEVVTQNGFLYVYWLQADERGFRLSEINNQFPKALTLWRRVGLDESAPLAHVFFLTVSTLMLALVYTMTNVGVLLLGGLLFAFLQRWEVYRRQPVFYQVLLAAVFLVLLGQTRIPGVNPRFFGMVHYGLSFGLATFGTYFALRYAKERGLFVYSAMFLLWMVLYQFFSLLPQNVLT